MQKFPSKQFRSSFEVDEDDPCVSPIKTPRRGLSPAQLFRNQLLINSSSERHLPLIKLQVTNGSGGSWSSISSLEEQTLESPKKKIEEQKSIEIPMLSLQKVTREGGSSLSERFQANISKPSLFLQRNIAMIQNKAKETKEASPKQETGFNLKPIAEEESPLMKIIRKKKEMDRLKNLGSKMTTEEKKSFVLGQLMPIKQSAIDRHRFRSLIFAPEIDENLFKKHLLITYKGVVYAKKLTQPSHKFLSERSILLEEINKKKTLFMDLDETLVHSCHVKENPDVVLEIKDGLSVKKIGFNVRPYCEKFLEKASRFFEIYVFTAASELYAKSIIEKIDPKHRIQQVFNKSCTMNTKNGFVIKDLRIFKNRRLEEMVIVDNLSHSFSFQIENGIPLLEWQSDRKDNELKYLYKYLKKVKEYEDVRVINREYLKLKELGELRVEDLGL